MQEWDSMYTYRKFALIIKNILHTPAHHTSFNKYMDIFIYKIFNHDNI